MTKASRDANGRLRARHLDALPLPKRGKKAVYIFTSAQNNTGLHEECWRNLNALATHDGARIIAARFTYAVKSRAAAGQKTAAEEVDDDEWWDPRLEAHFEDRGLQIAPGLVWCGELQILPTAVNPISGLESYTGRASSIIPHATFAMQSVASPKGAGAKLIYTTGCVTLRNYIQKKAGQKAEFHHGYGGLIVEVLPDGSWYVRQLNADSEGVIYDLDRRAKDGKVTRGHRPECIVWGDIHTRQLEIEMRALAWGKNGILETLRPKMQVFHDVLDFRSQNHHDRKDPWKTFAKHVQGKLDVAREVEELGQFLESATRPWCQTVIAAANHDEALLRWLKEADHREDPVNAEFMLDTLAYTYKAIRSGDLFFQPLKWAVEYRWGKPKNTHWLQRDEDCVVCPDEPGGGIKVDMHGDVGGNGARGSLKAFGRTGMKTVTGHTHAAGIQQGAYSVGVMGALDQGYNVGLSSWSHTNCLIQPNAKRQLFTIWKGRWRA